MHKGDNTMIINDRNIKASDGMILTNNTDYAIEVDLGVGDSPDNWYEITEEEYNAILEAENTES